MTLASTQVSGLGDRFGSLVGERDGETGVVGTMPKFLARLQMDSDNL